MEKETTMQTKNNFKDFAEDFKRDTGLDYGIRINEYLQYAILRTLGDLLETNKGIKRDVSSLESNTTNLEEILRSKK